MIASDGARMENIINGETQCYERCSNMIKTIVPLDCSNMDETKHGWKHHTVEELELKI